jgi:hypothetical protein
MNIRSIRALGLLAVSCALCDCNSSSGSGSGSGSGSSGGASCESLCTAENQRAGATQQSCSSYCTGVQTLINRARCTSQYQAFLACSPGGAGGQSGAQNPCAVQVSRLNACVLIYCEGSPTPAACSSNGSGTASSGGTDGG